MTMTQINIAYVISMGVWYSEKPKQFHWYVVKRILDYLKGITNYDFFTMELQQNLHGFCVIDYARNQDDYKFQTRYMFIFGNAIIAWCNQCQGCT
jgi:hypothetical protein